MLGENGLIQKLSQFTQTNGQPYVIYGDPAYGVTQNILAPFHGSQLSQSEQDFNKSMSRVRIFVEWTFGKIFQYFTYLDFKHNNKVLLQPIGKYYTVAALLTNCHTCLYGSITSSLFTSSLETYLSNIWNTYTCTDILHIITQFSCHCYSYHYNIIIKLYIYNTMSIMLSWPRHATLMQVFGWAPA